MSLFEELIEDKAQDKKIVKSFTPKDTLSEQIFEDNGKMREDVQAPQTWLPKRKMQLSCARTCARYFQRK